MWRFVIALGLVGMLAVGLAARVAAVGEMARGTLVDGQGNGIGSVELTEAANGVAIRVRLDNTAVVAPGKHGFHVHAVGKCDPADFTSAGGHFNPLGKQHGTLNPQGAHAGDVENLVVPAGAAGGVNWTTTSTLFTLSAGPSGVFDADGAALVIHAGEDDLATDPTGNRGGRVACAVLQPVAPGLPNTGAGGGRAVAPIAALVGVAAAAAVAVAGLALARRRSV
jgi:Cu-Zn family superoxide dismutase